MVPSNRISFGDALWKGQIIRTSIAHGCAVWISSSNASIASLESWQYKVAKLILDTNMDISKSDLFLELGRELIKRLISTDRGFPTLPVTDLTRLCRLVLIASTSTSTFYDNPSMVMITCRAQREQTKSF